MDTKREIVADRLTRFSSRVENYVKYRPHYPIELIAHLSAHCSLTPQSVIADIGSGTGILTELFLDNGNPVYAIEPNEDMRAAAEQLLVDYPDFNSIDGQSESPGLPDNSVDFIVAGQAFHWFEPDTTRQAFANLLKPGGWVALIWNQRETDTTNFLQAYEKVLLAYTDAYKEVNHRNADPELISNFFAPASFELATYANTQHFDFESLLGRLLSSSYAPLPGTAKYVLMVAELQRIFDAHQCDNHVTMQYTTKMYYGQWV